MPMGSSYVFGSLTGCLGNGNRAKKRPSSSSSTSFAKKAAAVTKKAPTQTFLDFGQKSLGKRTLCGVCGLLYVNGEAEDEKDHANFCRSISAGLLFQSWKDQRLVWGAEGKDRVIEVRPGDGGPQLLKMGEVKRIMDQEMGFVPLAEGESVLRPTEKAFLYVHDKRVVGCLVAEKIAAAHPVLGAMSSEEGEGREKGPEELVLGAKEGRLQEDDGRKACQDQAGAEKDKQEEKEQKPPPAKVHRVDDKDTTISNSSSSIGGNKGKRLAPASSHFRKGGEVNEEAVASLLPKGVAYSLHDKAEATLGIKQVWVSKNSRRKGIARRMLEVARARFYYGFVVPRDEVAFSQLSNAGYSFARSYTEGGGALLVY